MFDTPANLRRAKRHTRQQQRLICLHAASVVTLALVLLAEFTTLLLWPRFEVVEHFETRDPVSGAVYYTMLLIFAVMPLLVGRR